MKGLLRYGAITALLACINVAVIYWLLPIAVRAYLEKVFDHAYETIVDQVSETTSYTFPGYGADVRVVQ